MIIVYIYIILYMCIYIYSVCVCAYKTSPTHPVPHPPAPIIGNHIFGFLVYHPSKIKQIECRYSYPLFSTKSNLLNRLLCTLLF